MDKKRLETYGIVKAINKNGSTWVEGYLFKLEPPMRVFVSDPKEDPTWYVVRSQNTDWGLPCVSQFIEIDPHTICECCAVLPDGKKLFIGDKLESNDGSYHGAISLVNNIPFFIPFLAQCGVRLSEVLEDTGCKVKVIGNIYEKEKA